METDELTKLAYETITRADKVLSELRVEIDASAKEYSSEDDFLRGTLDMLRLISKEPEEYLDSWNYLDTMSPKQFAAGVKGLIGHVEKTLNTPHEQRGKAVAG